MTLTTTRLCSTLASFILLLNGIGHSGEVSSITSTFQGSSVPIGGSGTFQYNFTTTAPTTSVTSISFQSRLRFYTKFVAGGGLAQLFRRNTDFSVGFQVVDPEQIGYRVKIHRRIIGRSSINWTGPTGSNSSTGSVSYANGLVYVNGVSKSELRSGNFVSREARESNPTPPDVSHQRDRELILSGYKGTQTFTLNEYEPATQIVNAFGNYNTGSAELFFGLIPNLAGYSNSPDESGDTFTFTVIFNPACVIQQVTPASASIAFAGILQESEDLIGWADVTPQPSSPVQINLTNGRRFFRARSVE